MKRWLLEKVRLLFLMGLPLPAGGALTQQAMQGLATWDSGSWSTYAPAASFAMTPAQALNGSNTYLTLTGAIGAGFNVTTPTASQLYQQYLAAYGVPPTVGSTFTFELSNQTGETATLVNGTGVTINGTATVLTTVNRTWLATFTAVGATPAVTYQNLASRSN